MLRQFMAEIMWRSSVSLPDFRHKSWRVGSLAVVQIRRESLPVHAERLGLLRIVKKTKIPNLSPEKYTQVPPITVFPIVFLSISPICPFFVVTLSSTVLY